MAAAMPFMSQKRGFDPNDKPGPGLQSIEARLGPAPPQKSPVVWPARWGSVANQLSHNHYYF